MTKIRGVHSVTNKRSTPYRRAGRYRRSKKLYERAVRFIPRGIYGHKNPDLVLRGHSPYYAERAEGGRYWDVDGNEYLDLLCGYGPIVLGHNHPQVEDAVRRQAAKGNCFNHPGAVMVELAERLVDLIPGADWALFAKNGSDVTTWAIRVSREHTGRPKIVMVRDTYHGAHAWCSVYPGGVLPEDKAHVLGQLAYGVVLDRKVRNEYLARQFSSVEVGNQADQTSAQRCFPASAGPS
jgi:glutamate-1-semialdehyde aminotransferase